MRLSGAIETFLVFLPRRRANHRETGRKFAACNSLYTCRLWLSCIRCVHMCVQMHKRGKETESIGRVEGGEIAILITIDRTTPSFVSNRKKCIAKFMFSGNILWIPRRIFEENSNSLLLDTIKKIINEQIRVFLQSVNLSQFSRWRWDDLFLNV